MKIGRFSPRFFFHPLILLFIPIQFLPAEAQTYGKDGSKTVGSSEIVNLYTRLASNAAAGATQIRVAATTGFAAGDLLLIYQAQGATINTGPDDATYGTVTAYNNAGNYEFRGVASIAPGNKINLTSGLQRSYTAAGNAQVVRVPLYSSLAVTSGGTITAPAWDGQTGGIVAIHVNGPATIDGRMSADTLGFRGGDLTANGGTTGDITSYRTTAVADAAQKGEGIAGPASSLANGQYGRGAPANGGGGGNNHNAGGGGGSNGGNGNAWTGSGQMPGGCTGCMFAWTLDSAYLAGGGYAGSSGGGRGGYTYSANNGDATTQGPGNAAWGGANRRQRGGLGGRPLTADACARIFFGGGGGAGHQNNAVGGAGGRGGGILFLIASSVSGIGSMTADGQAGGGTAGAGNDAPGGGGGGGTIIVDADILTGISLNADGGAGGSQSIATAEAEGPGGGGGGGFIGTKSTSVTRSVNGGTGGSTNSSSLTEFPSNGATDGASGEIVSSLCTIPLPVQIVALAAHRSGGDALLRWMTATEMNNYGFEIQRRTGEEIWRVVGFVPGSGTTNAPRSYTFTDPAAVEAAAGITTYYRLRQIDRDGSSTFSATVELDGEEGTTSLPLLSAAPHPVGSGTNIRFTLARRGPVSLTMYTLLGDEIWRMAREGEFEPGSYAIPFDRGSLPAGVYILRLTAGGRTVTRRLTIL